MKVIKIVEKLFKEQETYYNTNITKDISYRIKKLKKLKRTIQEKEDSILKALYDDLGKSNFEAFSTEVMGVYHEIDIFIKKINKWNKPKRVKTPLVLQPSRSYILTEPKGKVAILSPWNYPFLLSMSPLVGAIGSGNTVMLKPSMKSINTTKILDEIITDVFPSEHAKVIIGDHSISDKMLELPFDHFFFTGSARIGKKVMKAASEHLSSITLELGGKSPCIIDENVNLDSVCKKVIFGKFTNSGQTCVAPDYLIVHKKHKDSIINSLIKYIKQFYGENPLESNDYGKIITHESLERLLSYIENQDVKFGGKYDLETLKMEPTILDNVLLDSDVMKDEIFGPILPILYYSSESEIYNIINKNPNPLALYVFSNTKQFVNNIHSNISFGGGCINDTIVHVGNGNVPFGGVRGSGIGKYHGIYSYDTFTNKKGIMAGSKFNLKMKYAPHTNSHLALLKKLVRK